MSDRRWFLEVVQEQNGTYSANMIMGGKPVEGLPSGVDYNTLRDAIRNKTSVVILKRKDMLFQRSGRRSFAFIDNTQERKDCRVTLDEMRLGWKPNFDGADISSDDKQPVTAVDDLLHKDKSFRYQLLDRLRSDCDYYLGYGNRYSKHLWAGSEKEQIACMKALWESFGLDDKPYFLSMEQIQEYEKKMVPAKPPLSAQISSAAARATEKPSVKEGMSFESER